MLPDFSVNSNKWQDNSSAPQHYTHIYESWENEFDLLQIYAQLQHLILFLLKGYRISTSTLFACHEFIQYPYTKSSSKEQQEKSQAGLKLVCTKLPSKKPHNLRDMSQRCSNSDYHRRPCISDTPGFGFVRLFFEQVVQ